MSSSSTTSSTAFGEFWPMLWAWSQSDCAPDVLLSSTGDSAMFFVNQLLESSGTSAVRGTTGFQSGQHYWEVIFLDPPCGTSVMVGLATKAARLQWTDNAYLNLIGQDKESWGLSYRGTVWHNGSYRRYCEPFYKDNTVIGCLLDLYEGTLSFTINGEDMGVAFTGLDCVNQPLYPIVSSTTVDTELLLGVRLSRFATLQQLSMLTIARSCNQRRILRKSSESTDSSGDVEEVAINDHESAPETQSQSYTGTDDCFGGGNDQLLPQLPKVFQQELLKHLIKV